MKEDVFIKVFIFLMYLRCPLHPNMTYAVDKILQSNNQSVDPMSKNTTLLSSSFCRRLEFTRGRAHASPHGNNNSNSSSIKNTLITSFHSMTFPFQTTSQPCTQPRQTDQSVLHEAALGRGSVSTIMINASGQILIAPFPTDGSPGTHHSDWPS